MRVLGGGAISGALQAKLHSATMVPLRRLADLHGICYYDDRDLCNLMGLAPPLLAARALRLRLFQRLICKGHRYVLSLLVAARGAQGSWLNLVGADLGWLSRTAEGACGQYFIDDWVRLIREQPAEFTKILQKASFAAGLGIEHWAIPGAAMNAMSSWPC